MKIQIILIHRALKISTVYTGFVCLSKLWQACSQYKLVERLGIDIWFAVMTWKSNSVCISAVQLFLLTCGWVRASQSTWTSVFAEWLPISLLLTAAPCWEMRQGQTWLLVVPVQPNPKGCLWLYLLWGLFLVYLEFPCTSPVVFRVMNHDCDHENHPCVSVSESWERCLIWKGRSLALPCSLEVSGCPLVSVCLKSFTPIPWVLWERRETLTAESVALTRLRCYDLPGLHHPGSQLFGSPWRNCLSPSQIVCQNHIKAGFSY